MNSQVVVSAEHITGSGTDADANARLIAAAPDLLKALQETLQSLEYVDRAHPETSGSLKRGIDIQRARDVIATIDRDPSAHSYC